MVGQLLSFPFIIALDHIFLLATDLLLGHLKERAVEKHCFFLSMTKRSFSELGSNTVKGTVVRDL
jgi:hypothetical protein